MKNKNKIVPKPTRSEDMEYWKKCPAINAGKNLCMFPDKSCSVCIGIHVSGDPVALTYRDLGVIALALPKLDILMPNFCEGHTDEETLSILEKIVKMQESLKKEGQ